MILQTSFQTCEQKNVVLKHALLKLANERSGKFRPETIKVNIFLTSFVRTADTPDCGTCYSDVLIAVGDCFGEAGWLQCIQDVLGAANPCIDCVCEVIVDVCNLFNCDWSCTQ